MRLIFTLLILSAFNLLHAQERIISGRLTSHDDGVPLPGVNIVIKGTTTGTTTDINGNYSIRVPIGAVLVFSFIGMQTREVLVTENNLQPAKNSPLKSGKHDKQRHRQTSIPHALYKDTLTRKVPGVAVLTDQTPSYNGKREIDPTEIRSIKRSGNRYLIKTHSDMVKRTGFGIQFTSSWGIDQVNRLPEFQNTYAQGQPVNGMLAWRGADLQEIFSWGPMVKTLEFDGSQYPYDKNGKLVLAGTGNAKTAKRYDAMNFFSTGSVLANELSLTLPTLKNGTLIFDVESRGRKGVIPNSDYQRLNLSAKLRNLNLARYLQLNASVSANQSDGNLLARGANLSSIVGSLYRSPVTFDNTNARSPEKAVNARDVYRLSDGTIRSHAPGLADNPYGLVNELPDQENLQRIMASLSMRYFPEGNFELMLSGNVDHQHNENTFGIPTDYSGYSNGRLTYRSDNQILSNVMLTPSYDWYRDRSELKFSVSYQNQYTNRELNRTDGFDFTSESFGSMEDAGQLITRQRTLDRMSHEILAAVNFEYNQWLVVRLNNRNYFSNTVKSSEYVNMFPSASLSINLADLIYTMDPVNELKIYTTISRTIREAPLLYSNWSYGSTQMPIADYYSFYETDELFFHSGLVPETERKLEAGLKFQAFNGLSLQFSWFNNRTMDFIAPVWDTDHFQLMNVADVKNYGSTITAGYSGSMGGEVDWGTDVRWSTYNSVALHVYGSNEFVPLAGFETIQTVLAPGKVVGSVYGTTYQRDEAGNKIIGSDGFPIENLSLKKIGDPIPDWTLGWSSYFNYRRFRLSFLFDFRKGGSIWNGTNAVLDYLGRSSATGKLRNTSNFIFDGVDNAGNLNTIPVNFADPSKPLTENRWVRYGWDGVGEDYVEDASWFRLNELVASYQIIAHNKYRIKEVKLSLIGRNLFVVTPYTGVDPSSSLYGYPTGNGMDVFNTPSTRSYNVQLTIKL